MQLFSNKVSDDAAGEMTVNDQEMFTEVGGQHDVTDDSSEAMNGLDAELLNALIKIPNLQKVILPQKVSSFCDDW